MSLLIAIGALVISILTFVLNAYYRTFRGPRLRIAFGDTFAVWVDHSGYVQLLLDVILINHGAQHAPVVKVLGSLQTPGQPEEGVHWKAFVESKNLGKEGEEFRAMFEFAGWARTLVVPGLSATSQYVTFISDRPMQLAVGTWSLKLLALGGSRGVQLARQSVRLRMTSADVAYIRAHCVTDAKGATEQIYFFQRGVGLTWRGHRRMEEFASERGRIEEAAQAITGHELPASQGLDERVLTSDVTPAPEATASDHVFSPPDLAEPSSHTEPISVSVKSSTRVPEEPPSDPPTTTMAILTTDGLLRYATGLEGQRLTTAGGRATFTVRVLQHGLEVTPASSGNPRSISRETIQLVIEQYEQSRNLQPGHYQSLTFDASYLLGIIVHFLREQTNS